MDGTADGFIPALGGNRFVIEISQLDEVGSGDQLCVLKKNWDARKYSAV